jgi:hypothetical protein
MAATSLHRSKTALRAAFRRIARHQGGAVAVFATARHLARFIYRMLRYGHDYLDIGETAYDHQFRIRTRSGNFQIRRSRSARRRLRRLSSFRRWTVSK